MRNFIKKCVKLFLFLKGSGHFIMLFFATGAGYARRDGFTLIEMAIVLVLMSLLMTTALSFWRIHAAGQGRSTTRENLARAQDALRAYVALNGHYPCPASRLAARDSDDYGRALPNCRSDIRNDSDQRTVAAKGRNGDYVRIGILPFRSLGLPDIAAEDGWRNFIQYAVTEKLTTPATFHQLRGAIDVVDESGRSRLTPPASAQYILFSSGADGAGGYPSNGAPALACPKKMMQTQNCDDNAVFLEADSRLAVSPEAAKGINKKKSATVISYDDYLSYLQYDPALHINAGLLFYYADACPTGFEEVPLAEEVSVADIQTLTSYAQNDPRFEDQDYGAVKKLCASNMYSQKLEIRSAPKDEVKSNCPAGWTAIGYVFFGSGMLLNREICAR